MVLGLSMYPLRHVHLAKPLFSIVHCVLGPQGDGSHGLCGSLQGTSGGFPSYSGKQKQAACPLILRHPVFGPQGFGEHSSPSGTVERRKKVLVTGFEECSGLQKDTYCNS